MVSGPTAMHRDIPHARGGSVGTGGRRGLPDRLLWWEGQEGVRHRAQSRYGGRKLRLMVDR